MVVLRKSPPMPELTDSLNFLWAIDFEYQNRRHHGALMRYFNFARELIALGHTITFAVNFLDRDRRPSTQYFLELKQRGVLTDFVEANYELPLWRVRAAARLVYPKLGNAILRPLQREFAARIDAIARKRASKVILISGLRLLFLPLRSQSGSTFLYDMGDCQTLYERRQIALRWKERDIPGLLGTLRPALFAYAREHYYGRRPVMKIMVSPVDKKAIDAITGMPDTSAVVLNGATDGAPRDLFPKIPGRIIFTGNMDFPPNYEAALWFLNRVFPIVLSQRPDACFVIAGANPVPALQQRAQKNVIVTGYVEDLNREIASSEIFVAPLISGGGFKNKVVEAIMNRTSVVATSLAVEFFAPEIRGLLSIADSPAEMAQKIMALWKDREDAEGRAQTVHQLVKAQFGWASGAAKIVELAREAMARSSPSETSRA
jgi:glycosyltransferase involved in cell wall biosynthesis